jgi:glycosyltransferase involved in cell wall biosynthesis
LRIAFIGHFQEVGATGDMGTRAVGRHLSVEAAKRHIVQRFEIRDFRGWIRFRDFKPDILHFVLGPTTAGLMGVWLWRLPYRKVPTVISAPNPDPHVWKTGVALARPDLVLVQSEHSEHLFSSLGMRTLFLPNGVDLRRFTPVPDEEKRALRLRYGFHQERFTILHVGPLLPSRNLSPLVNLRRAGYQVVIVGRKPADMAVHRVLTEAGCTVILDFIEQIQEFYQLSDLYLFPVPPENRTQCIETPLSLLEAMATNLTVLTTRFGALPRLFSDDRRGFYYFSNPSEIENLIGSLVEGDFQVNTRALVQNLSWEDVGGQLEELYKKLPV